MKGGEIKMAGCESECSFGYCDNKDMQTAADKAIPTVQGFIAKFKRGVYDCLTSPDSLAVSIGQQQKDCPGFKEKMLVGASPATICSLR